MRIVYAFGWLPIVVLKEKPPHEFRGYTRILTVLIIPITWIQIHPDYWNDDHILIHELQHVEDYLRNPFLYWFRYRTQAGRLHYESRAYARQYVSYGEENLIRFARYVDLLESRYDLEHSRLALETALHAEIDRLVSQAPA